MDSFGIAVLGVLNQEHHQECDDGRARINNQLPGIRKMKRRSGHAPNYDDENRYREGPCATQNGRGIVRENAKCIPDDTEEVPRSFALF